MWANYRAVDIAEALGVSANLVLRARMTGPQHRNPPKGWEAKLKELALARARELEEFAESL